MPLHDGTGPLGRGAGTGRGKGVCCGFGYKAFSHSVFHARHGWFLGILLPVGTAILRDLLNPSGVLRRIVNTSLNKSMADDSQKIVRETECTVMNTDLISPLPGKKV